MNEVLEQIKRMQEREQASKQPTRLTYAVSLSYETNAAGLPVPTRIGYIRIDGINNEYRYEGEVRPQNRPDTTDVPPGYWDRPLFKVFYRKITSDIVRGSELYFDSQRDIKSWQQACDRGGIVNNYILRVKEVKDTNEAES